MKQTEQDSERVNLYLPKELAEKVRLEAKIDGTSFMLDSVKGVGDFLEIEVLSQEESSIAEAEKHIMAIAVELELTDKDIELRKYDQLVAQVTR